MTERRRKIIYLSGTRADFGLMKSTLQRLATFADLSVAVTGMHLGHAFGHTVDAIRASGLRVCGELPIDVGSRTAVSMSIGVADCLHAVTQLLQQERPDLLVLLGDRGEMLAGAIAALHLGIVCVHIHGGERSGTVDEPVRHAISKLSTYHLVATEQSKDRLLRMGESSKRVWVCGAPGLDGITDDATPHRQDCMHQLDLPVDKDFVLALFHPVVQQAGQAQIQTSNLLQALSMLNLPVIWLEPNADAGSLEVLRALDENPLPADSRRVAHLPRSLFCASMKHCAVMLGNSSAGIIEAATFGTPVLNVGDRQRLRERGANVQDVPALAEQVHRALMQAMAHGKWPCSNPYGDGQAGARIVEHLLSVSLAPAVLEKINAY